MRGMFGDQVRGGLIGSPETIRKGLAEFEAAGVQELIIGFAKRTDPEQLRFFAREFGLTPTSMTQKAH